MQEFFRIRRLPPYVFEQVNRAKAAARNAGADIIDLGMGNPDLPAPLHVVDKLKETVGKPRTDRYSASRGIPGLRRAQAAYYHRRFGVKLDPEREIVATLGSKEGFANVAQAIIAPGDVVLVPNPSYPIHAFGFLMAGGVIRSVPSDPTPSFFEALERAVIHSIPKPIAVVVCYPANPTAYVASLEFYRDLVAFAKKHGLFVLSDLAYAEVYFDDHPPPSVLQVPGAIDVTVEFTSLSKTYSMPGWRMGFAVGNERIISALARVKSYLDYGAFTPVQVAATAALNGPDECIQEMRATYKRRRDVLVESFGRAGWPIPAPRASMFAWAPIPPAFQPLGSLEFSTLLVEKAELAVSPGIAFGEHGEGFVRIALVENEQRIRQAARNVRRFLETGAESRSCRTWHGRRFRGASDRAPARGAGGALRPPDRGRRGYRPLAQQTARPRSQPISLGRRRSGARRRSRDRRFHRGDRRRERSRQARGRGGTCGRQIGGHGQQGAARPARGGARGARRTTPCRAELRGGGRRRHSHRQDAARRSRRQFAGADLRHPQRHLQLHPDPDGARESVLRAEPRGSAAPGLCGSRSFLRHRGSRHRAETGDPREPRLRHPGRSRRGLRRGHRLDHARRSARRRRSRLPHQAPGRRGEDRERHRAARASDDGAEGFGDRPGHGRDQRGHRGCRRRARDHVGGSRRRGRGNRLGGGLRHRRYRPRRAHGAVRAPVGPARIGRESADATPRGRLLHSHARGRQAGDRRPHRDLLRRGEHLARIDHAAAFRASAAGRRGSERGAAGAVFS